MTLTVSVTGLTLVLVTSAASRCTLPGAAVRTKYGRVAETFADAGAGSMVKPGVDAAAAGASG